MSQGTTVNISADPETLVGQYQMMHAKDYFTGNSMVKHADAVGLLINKFKARRLLDYGSGKGHQYLLHRVHEAWGIPHPVCYDPAVFQLNTRPSTTFEGVICTDVMEHIPPDKVEVVLADIFSYAEKFVFFSVSTQLAKKRLPNRQNCHLTVQPADWWREKIKAFAGQIYHEVVFDQDG